jgi:hypothetical protein
MTFFGQTCPHIAAFYALMATFFANSCPYIASFYALMATSFANSVCSHIATFYLRAAAPVLTHGHILRLPRRTALFIRPDPDCTRVADLNWRKDQDDPDWLLTSGGLFPALVS